MNFSRFRIPGGWITGTTIQPAEMEGFDAMRPLLIDTAAGGSYAPTGQIHIGGLGLDVQGPCALSLIKQITLRDTGTFDLISGSDIDAQSGSLMDVDGTVTVANGGAFTTGAASSLTKNDGSTWTLNGAVNLTGAGTVLRTSLGGKVQIGSGGRLEIVGTGTATGPITWEGSSNYPKVSSRSIPRKRWRLAAVQYIGGNGPTNPAAWPSLISGGRGPGVRTGEFTASSPIFLLELLDMPAQGTIGSYVIRTLGASGTPAVVRPRYLAVRWLDDGPRLNMSALTTDGHTGANWSITEVNTTVTVTSSGFIEAGYRYGVLVHCARDSNAPGASFQVLELTANVTVTEIHP